MISRSTFDLISTQQTLPVSMPLSFLLPFIRTLPPFSWLLFSVFVLVPFWPSSLRKGFGIVPLLDEFRICCISVIELEVVGKLSLCLLVDDWSCLRFLRGGDAVLDDFDVVLVLWFAANEVEGIGEFDEWSEVVLMEVVANCWRELMGDEEVSRLVCSCRRLLAALLGDDSDDLGNLGGLDPPSQDPSLLECCEILKIYFITSTQQNNGGGG